MKSFKNWLNEAQEQGAEVDEMVDVPSLYNKMKTHLDHHPDRERVQTAIHQITKLHGPRALHHVHQAYDAAKRKDSAAENQHLALAKHYSDRHQAGITEEFIAESAAKSAYNDEHAHANVWNHMVSKGIAHDHEAMKKELHHAQKNEKHPLHFKNASHEGFAGGKKTASAKDSYHQELHTATHTIHAMATHPDFKKAVKEKHKATVMGASRGDVSSTWKKHGATQGAVSKADVSISKDGRHHEGLRMSMKKGGGSQLMSAGPEETAAVHDHATKEMLAHHPKYKNLSASHKDKIHAHVMSKMKSVATHLNAMKTAKRKDLEGHKNAAQKHLDHVHDTHPELNHYVRKEATTGEGKFGKGSAHAASYLVKSAEGHHGASVKHVSKVNYDGPRLRVALPKGDGRSGNVKADER